jgi:hypothetical protein
MPPRASARHVHPRNAVHVAETIADRLEGRPVQKVESQVIPQAVFYQAGTEVPPQLRDQTKNDAPPPGPPLEEFTR